MKQRHAVMSKADWDAYMGQMRNELIAARTHLSSVAAEARTAQRLWDGAIDREARAHQSYRDAGGDMGEFT